MNGNTHSPRILLDRAITSLSRLLRDEDFQLAMYTSFIFGLTIGFIFWMVTTNGR